MQIGSYIQQKSGYKAFIPAKFPPDEKIIFSDTLIQKASYANLLLGRLDGICYNLPDVEFFIFMYIRKDAESSSQIEGTMATAIDSMEAEIGIKTDLPEDVDDILHYIQALNYGMERLKTFPLSLRFIREIHLELMKDARSTHYSAPGEFRKTQNWIGGTRPDNAFYVPPTVEEMNRCLDDLENFFNIKDEILPVIKVALIHSQFETIHPFLDGNGRTGRMIITLYLWINTILQKPMLYLSAYFKKHQKVYYERLNGYHNGKIEEWVDFFLDGIIDTATDAIETSKKITEIRSRDMEKIQKLGKKPAESAITVLKNLYKLPVVNLAKMQEWTGFSRQGALNVINRLIELDILKVKDENVEYGKTYIYKDYLDIFSSAKK